MRATLGAAVAVFALALPVRAEYWDVNDGRLIEHLVASAQPADGLILSPAGTYLTAYYGPWPVAISVTSDRSNATRAEIARDRTAHLPSEPRSAAFADGLLATEQPPRVWYVAFRTTAEPDVLSALAQRGYFVTTIVRTTRGELYLGVRN